MKNAIKKVLTIGKDDVYFEVVDQVNVSVRGADDNIIQTTFSKLRPGSSPSSKTTQVPNVIPLASNYLEGWKGVGPLHDLKFGVYRSLLEKKGLVRCSLTATNCELKDPTEHALKNKHYSWQYGGGLPKKSGDGIHQLDAEGIRSGSEATQFHGCYPLATIQQGNFVFSFFQKFDKRHSAKILIWSVATFEKALQSGELEGIKGGFYSWDKATQLIVKPTTLSPVGESKDSSEADGTSYVDTQVQFTFGAPLETVQAAFDGEPSFLFCWIQPHYPRKSKPVETTPSALTTEELESFYHNDNIDTYPFDDEEDQNGVEFVEGNVYTIARQAHCVSNNGSSENILAGFETPCYSARYGFSLPKDSENLLWEALHEAENSTTFSIVEVEYDEESL